MGGLDHGGRVVEMPTQRAIIALAIESFDAHTIPQQASLRRELLALAELAADEINGLSWDDFQIEDRGDGVLLLILPAYLPVKIAGLFIPGLNERLAGNAPQEAGLPPMRLRAALHLGLANRIEESRTGQGWSGEGVDLARSLAAAGPVAATLRAARRAQLAFIVSDETFESVIRHEPRLIDAQAYAPVRFDAGQGTAVKGWIMVPGYSSPPPVETDHPASGADPGPSVAGTARPTPDPAARLVSQHVDVVHGNNIGIQVNNAGSVRL
jgi:hypothetical protein